MKALTIPTLILALLLSLSLWIGSAVRTRTEACLHPLAPSDALAREENWSQAAEQLRQSYRIWQQCQFFFHAIMEHQELDEAESLFAAAFAACDEEDEPDFHTALAQLQTALEHLREKQQLRAENIF